MKEYTNLTSALYPYQENLDLDDRQRLDWLKDNIAGNFLHIEQLKRELQEVLNDKDFNWVSFAEANSLLILPSLYQNREIANYIKYVLLDFLYPESKLDEKQIEDLKNDVKMILKECIKNNGWMFSYELYDILQKIDKYRNLEYYNLWKIVFNAPNIERKIIDEKYQEIGCLRFKESV